MTILNEIVEHKKQEIQNLESFDELFDRINDMQNAEALNLTKGFFKTLRDVEGPALIAELKKASPSKGLMREDFDPSAIAREYHLGGAHCFSVLTDNKYFQGSYENLIVVSSEYQQPCLCKEFIVDAKQIAQARLSGADAVLLIAAILDDYKLEDFRDLANELAMDVLVEVHDSKEMQRVLELGFDMIGINNRDLKTFEVSLDTSSRIMSDFKFDVADKLMVAESGIHSHKDVNTLHSMGFKAFLVGESLLKSKNIMAATSDLLGLE